MTTATDHDDFGEMLDRTRDILNTSRAQLDALAARFLDLVEQPTTGIDRAVRALRDAATAVDALPKPLLPPRPFGDLFSPTITAANLRAEAVRLEEIRIAATEEKTAKRR